MEEITTESYMSSFGVPNLDVDKRHVECTDCHNPHRVVKNSLYDETGLTTQATHDHSEPHDNRASGVLRGMWGVEPLYLGTTWDTWPPLIYEKAGTPDALSPLQYEYQLCLKCHSSYAYGDSPPVPGSTGGNTAFGENDLETYTDQAKEFNPDNTGFHPVIEATDDTLAIRSITGGNPWLTPFGAVGNQTMYCSDCHGKDTLGTGENSPSPGGPHGSENEFILLGKWDFNTGTQNATNGIDGDLCFKCHDPDVYSYAATLGSTWTGYAGTAMMGEANLHAL
ncbi:MAG: hypothetical protein GY790_13940, partial [Bacteroidetes bacterium]|nr:hypothetical protein [Bacteroidota bacterium]